MFFTEDSVPVKMREVIKETKGCITGECEEKCIHYKRFKEEND